jgi:hypothetical protein
MQLTLVSHYGSKPPPFAALIEGLQRSLTMQLGAGFIPYAIEQVHATIAGVEGTRTPGGIRNENFRRYRNEERHVQFPSLLAFLRERFREFEVRVGGFSESAPHGFTSQGRTPFLRSFSIQGEIAVAMGWPWQNLRSVSLLDQLRRKVQEFGILHKWHRTVTDVDNDFFFVLGKLNAQLRAEQRRDVERHVREQLGAMPPCRIDVDRQSLAFVAYTDPQLPPASSQVLKVMDAAITPSSLEDLYG